MDVDTSSGLARLTWYAAPSASSSGVLLLGHGAGGGFNAPDLLLVAALARDAGLAVGLVAQPYRVAGRRAPAPPPRLDAAFVEVAAVARADADKARSGAGRPLIVGGRSSGARVACRTALAVGAEGVLALAFPLRPPGRQAPSRLPELVAAGVPVLVVQGERDAFGSADQVAAALAGETTVSITLTAAEGADHALRKGIDAAEISAWLAGFLP